MFLDFGSIDRCEDVPFYTVSFCSDALKLSARKTDNVVKVVAYFFRNIRRAGAGASTVMAWDKFLHINQVE